MIIVILFVCIATDMTGFYMKCNIGLKWVKMRVFNLTFVLIISTFNKLLRHEKFQKVGGVV